jgi:hypothetical protein
MKRRILFSAAFIQKERDALWRFRDNFRLITGFLSKSKETMPLLFAPMPHTRDEKLLIERVQ